MERRDNTTEHLTSPVSATGDPVETIKVELALERFILGHAEESG